MANENVPIIEVTDENFEAMWPAISNAITQASFIALDCELSGLGNRSKLNWPEIDVRYQNARQIVQEYSIVSLGISCFSCHSCSSLDLQKDGESVKTHNYLVQTFNVLTLCSSQYVVESNSLKFLLSHGFDFNRQYSHGLPYVRGEDPKTNKPRQLSVKNIFHLIIKLCKPIVLHNGFMDLMFLYQSFYTDLPKNVETFAADLLELFPAGIYDTKYISEFHQSFSATFLEYIFKKLQLENEARSQKRTWHCRIKFPPYPENGFQGLTWHSYLQVFDEAAEDDQPLCESYKFHGWCKKSTSCLMSHNVNRIVRELNCPTAGRKRKKNKSNGVASSSVAQLISMKRHKMEALDKQNSPSVKDNLDSLKTDEIVVLENCSNKADGSDKASNGPANARGTAVPQGQNDLIDITDDNGQTKGSSPGKSDHENDVTILDEDEDSIQEVFSAEEGRGPEPEILDKDNADPPPSGKSASTQEKERSASTGSPTEVNSRPCESKDCNGHIAGYDAFMTGHIFACDVASLGCLQSISAFQNAQNMNFERFVGKVYLIGKSFPFLVRSSDYARTSPSHDRLIKMVRS